MDGWHGRALHVHLTDGSIRSQPITPELLQAYLGGRGLGVRMMRDDFRRDPFDPDIPLIFAVGPLCGTEAPTAARMAVVSRSPLTGTIFDSSAGGRFPLNLKRTGHDALIVTGRSPMPVVLRLTSQTSELSDATALAGKPVDATVRRLARFGSVAAIGPAGENRVLYASICTGEGNAAARGGLGAVMGSKNLKAIAVDGGCQTGVAEPDRVRKATSDVMRLFRASPVLFGELGFHAFGTPALVDLVGRRRMAPTDNFDKTTSVASTHFSGPAISGTLSPRPNACHDCPIACKQMSPQGEYLPEYDALSHFGALVGLGELPEIVEANTLCRELGLDPVSSAATLAAWQTLREKPLNGEQVLRVLNDIARRRGDGELLALGARRMAEQMGRPEIASTVKSLELPAYDPRGAYGMALAYATSNRGGCQTRAMALSHEILRKPVATNRFSLSGKGRIVKIAEDDNAVVDSLVACKFAFFAASLEEYADLLSGVTGIAFTADDFGRIGERINLTERYYNQENGFDADDDLLPERFFRDAGCDGDDFPVPPIDRERFLEERARYYRMRGLDPDGRLTDTGFLERQP